jgi:hypothetical protein
MSTKAAMRPVGQVTHVVELREISRAIDDLHFQIARDLFRGGFQLHFMPGTDRHIGSCLGIDPRNRLADTFAASGDESAATFKREEIGKHGKTLPIASGFVSKEPTHRVF